ncbi:MAG: hypothetical protein HN350_15510, partial [Phycisphaerales bacterium]|nr:hypothetical protein [Phycisphaerales bacterium]
MTQINKPLSTAILIVSSLAMLSPAAAEPPARIPTPTKAQQVWQDCEIGLLFCFDLPIAAEIYTKNNTHRQRDDPNKHNPT